MVEANTDVKEKPAKSAAKKSDKKETKWITKKDSYNTKRPQGGWKD